MADAYLVAGTCRPTRLLQASIAPASAPTPTVTTPGAQAGADLPQTPSWAARLRQLPALVGCVVGFAADALVLALVLTLALPVLFVCAIRAAIAPAGLRIDTRNVRKGDLEDAYNASVCSGIEKQSLGDDTDGVAEQFKKDLPRQSMYIGAGPDNALVALEKDYDLAIPKIRALCADDAGTVDKSYLWAVTDLCAQGLLNEICSQLMTKKAVTYAGYEAMPSLDGDTTHEVRRLSSDAVAIGATMLMPTGVRIGILDGPRANHICREHTPLRLDIKIVVYKGNKQQPVPSVHVAHFDLKPI